MQLIALTLKWNLVNWTNLKFGFTGNAAAWITIAGALLCIFIPYLIGSINPAILISKYIFRDDIRTHGSGNGGSTNMLRTFGKGAAIATFLLDIGKAALAFWLGFFIWSEIGASIAGFFVVFGHMFPVYTHFKGGKGVACLAMIALCQSPITFLFLLLIFLIIAVGTKYISLASIMSAIFYPIILNAFDGPIYTGMAVTSACFVVFMHRENIKRLLAGQESKVSFKKKEVDVKKKKQEQAPDLDVEAKNGEDEQ